MDKILIAEDDEKLRNELEIFLNNNGYETIGLKTFDDTLNDILKINPRLLLLDINLPGADGEYICKELRKKSNMPIIIITSRDNEIDELLSINNGADHYVTKPFNIHILLAKINSLLRRSNMVSDKVVIDAGDFVLNVDKSTIEKDGNVLELTKNEFRILKFLVQNMDKIVTREEIMICLWDSDSFIGDSTLTVNMTRLRNKLDEMGLENLIETKRGQGYILKRRR
ncbi:MAG: response regulator transcription factor [bacterium]|nr:response regulator transcription factor [bacterium]